MESAATKIRPQLGKYTLVAEIARGGMGIVYLAQMSGPAGFEKLAVIKQLKPELAEDEKFLGMFMDEARLAARLNHRNIVQTNEVGEDAGRYFMAMEYLEGKTFQSVRARLNKGAKALPAAMVVRIACEVLAGLHYAHELAGYDGKPLGIVHRDVSAQNIFLTYDGQVRVLDFGVAKALGRAQDTEVGMLKGRVVCMSPEHVSNHDVDRRADIFSMGVMLRETLTGKRLWEELPEMDVIKNLLSKRVPPFPTDGTNVPDGLRIIVEKAMAVAREDRYATAADMRIALESWLVSADAGGSLARLGDMVSGEFADHRERVRAMLEKHRAGTSNEFFAGELPLIPQSSPEMGGSQPSISSVSSRRRLLTTSGTNPGSVSRTVTAGEMASMPGHSMAAHPPRSRLGLIFAGIGIAALAIGGTAFVMKNRSDAATADRTPPTATVTPATTQSGSSWIVVQPDVVELTVRTTPPNAQIFLDDALVAENPFKAKFPRGGMHTIRVVAPGHTPKIETITLNEATSVSVSLDRTGSSGASTPTIVAQTPQAHGPAVRKPEPTEAKPPSHPATPSAAPATPTEFTPSGGKTPQRNIDQKNPYNQ